jgi:membrane associated rhomboid family serine protease
MIIPWGTDAPIYHRPVATLAIMVLNVVSYLFFPAGAHPGWALELGDGLHPHQWVTSLFMHSGLFHLIGNTIFLWTFGFVVEGKLGWWAFALVYLAIGASESAAIQVLVQSNQTVRMLGASGVIFGLLGMCLVWAPKNEVHCMLWLRFMPTEIDLPIIWFGVLYLCIDVLTAGLSGVVMATATSSSTSVILAVVLNQSAGAIIGIVLGIVLLKLRLVDCENWDIFAVIEGREGQSRRRAKKGKTARRFISAGYAPAPKRKERAGRKPKGRGTGSPVKSIVDPSTQALRAIREHLDLGEVEAALAVYRKTTGSRPDWQFPESDCRDLAKALLEQHAWEDAAAVMRDHVRFAFEPSARIRLKLAQVLIEKLARPMQALKVLEEIPEGTLSESLEEIRQRLVQQATEIHEDEEGPMEFQDEL